MTNPVNPFRPGFAVPPAVIAGRDDVLAAAEEAFATVAVDGHTPMPIFILGPRGMGKTVILDAICRSAAEAYGWPSLFLTAAPKRSLLKAVYSGADEVHRVMNDGGDGKRVRVTETVLRAQVAGIGGEIHLSPPGAASRDPLPRLLEALAEQRSGLVLVIDEAQSSPTDDFAGLAAHLQDAVRSDAPLVTAIAGLPALRRRSADTEGSLGYLERADWHTLGLLSKRDAGRALGEAASMAGRPITPSALDRLIAASGGYPYALQVYGRHAWRFSNDRPEITVEHAQAALGPAEDELARNLYQGRMIKISPQARAYLLAVADISAQGERTTHRLVAERLGRQPRQLSTLRARLLDQGTLMLDGEWMRLMTPGFGPWLRAQRPPTAASSDL